MMTALTSAYAPTRRALCALSRFTLSSTSSSFPFASLRPSSAPPPSLCTLSVNQHRHASHASQGRANRAKRGPGKRLGLKKGASEPVVPGNVIFRQRGTQWFAGENCVMGRDHTINALQPGFVRYYRDPARHPTRKYIGVVLQQDETLPRPVGAARRRRLGMVARPLVAETMRSEGEGEDGEVAISTTIPADKKFDAAGTEAMGIPLPRSFADRSISSANGLLGRGIRLGPGRTLTNAQIGALGDRVTAKLKRETRAKTKLRILRDKLNIRKRRVRRRAAGEGKKQTALFDKRERKLRRAKGRYRGKR